MQLISRRTHGILDYLVGLVLILSPRLFGFDLGSTAAGVPVFLGWVSILYSLLTHYELGLLRVISFRAHLAFDTVSGIFLTISPWLLGFADRTWGFHLILGLLSLGVVAMTRRAADLSTHGSLGGTPAHR